MRRQTTLRTAFTLVELVVSLTTASILTVGLASSLYISNQTLSGMEYSASRNAAADIQNDLNVDLTLATSFSTTNADEVEFTVPDRDNDSSPETINYRWTGMPDAQLQYSFNGSAAVTLLEEVQNCNFTYLPRTVPTTAPSGLALPNPLLWGNRWSAASSTIGYEDIFTDISESHRVQIGTKVSLPEAGTIESITAYLESDGKKGDFGYAIYSHSVLFDRPIFLIAQTSIQKSKVNGWTTLPISPTNLGAGTYWLVLSYDSNKFTHREDAGGTTHEYDFRATQSGFSLFWGFPSSSRPTKVSIYANYSAN